MCHGNCIIHMPFLYFDSANILIALMINSCLKTVHLSPQNLHGA